MNFELSDEQQQLADSLGKALDLDIFEIETASEGAGGRGASVTLGEQVGPRSGREGRDAVGAAGPRPPTYPGFEADNSAIPLNGGKHIYTVAYPP